MTDTTNYPIIQSVKCDLKANEENVNKTHEIINYVITIGIQLIKTIAEK